MNEIRTKIAEGGRIVIPAEYRQALNLRVGDEVILRLEDDTLRVLIPLAFVLWSRKYLAVVIILIF